MYYSLCNVLHIAVISLLLHLASKNATIDQLRHEKQRAEDEKCEAYNQMVEALEEQEREHDSEIRKLKASTTTFEHFRWDTQPVRASKQEDSGNRVRALEHEADLSKKREQALIADKKALEDKVKDCQSLQGREQILIAEKKDLEARIKMLEHASKSTPPATPPSPKRAIIFSDKALENEIADLKKEREEFIQKYYHELRGRDEEINALTDQVSNLQGQVSAPQEGTCANHEAMVTRLMEQLDHQFRMSTTKEEMLKRQHEEALAGANAVNRAQQAEGQKLLEENEDLKTENHILKELMEDDPVEKTELEQREQRSKHEIEDLNAKLVSAMHELASSRQQVDRVHQDWQYHHQKNVNSAHEVIAVWTQRANDAKKEVEQYQQGVKAGEATIIKLQQQVEGYRHRANDAEKQVEQYQHGVKGGETTVKKLQQELEACRQRAKTGNATLEDFQQRLIRGEAGFIKLEQELERYRQQAKRGDAKVTKLKEEVEGYRQREIRGNAMLTELKEQLRQSQHQAKV